MKEGDSDGEDRLFNDIGSQMRVNKGTLDNVHPTGVWRSPEPIVSKEELQILDEELGQGLETRGRRDLKWYGANWLGYGALKPTAHMPARSQRIVDAICKRTGFPKVTVATLHRYYRNKSQGASQQQLGSYAGRKMAIVPHTDDELLTGNGGVMMVQVQGDAEVIMSRRGRKGGNPEILGSADRPLGHVVVCEGEVCKGIRRGREMGG